jgi:transposase-like protein
MRREWLEARLRTGRTIESIAHEVGKHPTTVAYWVNKHGLASHHSKRVAARGAIEADVLTELVERGLSIRAIAAELGRSAGTIRHWLDRHGLRTQPARYADRRAPGGAELVRANDTAGRRSGALGRTDPSDAPRARRRQ